jgi:hypothetical protein
MLEAKTLVEECDEMATDSGPFYIRNGERIGDQILFAIDGSVSG